MKKHITAALLVAVILAGCATTKEENRQGYGARAGDIKDSWTERPTA